MTEAIDSTVPLTPEEIRVVIAESVFHAVIKRDGLVPFQHPDGTEGYRGIDLSGWWIYQRSDGSLFGTNYATESDLRTGNIAEILKHKDYLKDRNDTWEAAQLLGTGVIKAMRYHLYEICGQMNAHHATAAQEAEAIMRSIGKWRGA